MTEITQITGINAESILARFDLMQTRLEAFEKMLSSRQPNQGNDFLTRKQVVQKLQITMPTLYAWTKKKIIQSYHIGNRVYYKQSEIEAVLTSKHSK